MVNHPTIAQASWNHPTSNKQPGLFSDGPRGEVGASPQLQLCQVPGCRPPIFYVCKPMPQRTTNGTGELNSCVRVLLGTRGAKTEPDLGRKACELRRPNGPSLDLVRLSDDQITLKLPPQPWMRRQAHQIQRAA